MEKLAVTRIILEIIKAACEEDKFIELLLLLVHSVWEERQVPQEWTLIPIPKKENLSDRKLARQCSLGCSWKTGGQNVTGEAAKGVAVSQCGFHKGRSCSDVTFTVRHLVEKRVEHGTKLFLVSQRPTTPCHGLHSGMQAEHSSRGH